MTVEKLMVALSAANPKSLVWGVSGVMIDKKIVYLVDKEGNILVKRNEQ